MSFTEETEPQNKVLKDLSAAVLPDLPGLDLCKHCKVVYDIKPAKLSCVLQSGVIICVFNHS